MHFEITPLNRVSDLDESIMEQAGAVNLPVGVTSVGEGEEDFKKDISHTEDVIKMPNSPTSLKAVSRYADMPRKQALRVL